MGRAETASKTLRGGRAFAVGTDVLATPRISTFASVAVRPSNGDERRRPDGLGNAGLVGLDHRASLRTAVTHLEKGPETVYGMMGKAGGRGVPARGHGRVRRQTLAKTAADLEQGGQTEGEADVQLVLTVVRVRTPCPSCAADTGNGCDDLLPMDQLAELWRGQHVVRPRTNQEIRPSVEDESAKEAKRGTNRVPSDSGLTELEKELPKAD
jgi:hypothetical protein